MNMHHKLYSIASLLDQSMEGAHRFVQEVNLALPNRVSYGKICHAISKLPVRERTTQGVAEYFLETECFIGGPYREHKPTTQIPITKHIATISTRRPREITTKVVGVTLDGRQAVVAKITMNEEIVLCREPKNSYDCNAIRVERLNGEQIGYINRHLAAELAYNFDADGGSARGYVTELTGGGYDGYSLGVNIKFTMCNAREFGRKH